MIAMQYEISLPADYDMSVIRRRVETRGALTDGFAGLGLKAYLIRERGVLGSAVNEYAPFYLWRTADGMRRFLCGEGFAGLCASFGRPRVEQAMGLVFGRGSVADGTPQFATRRIDLLAPGALPAVSTGSFERLLDQPGLFAAAAALDPAAWRTVEFALWTRQPPADAGIAYRVLHLSTPELSQL